MLTFGEFVRRLLTKTAGRIADLQHHRNMTHRFLLVLFLACLLFQRGNAAPQLKQGERRTNQLEGPVKYQAEEIYFSYPKQTSLLIGNVRIEYQNLTLTAGKVLINWRENKLIAEGIADSTDSLGNPVMRQLPVLTEQGQEPIYGQRLEYDFKHQRGKILHGKTDMPPGVYRGEVIKKVGEKTLLIRNGYFTTCKLPEHPHYYFKSNKMRVIVNKRAVAKPIVMYIADVPVLGLPFGTFPLEKGRRSGFIIPTYGKSPFGGRYLRGIGYYWAASDYFDLTLLTDFYERTGNAYHGEIRYKKRYAFGGMIKGTYMPRDISSGAPRQRWYLNFSHNQTLGDLGRITASGNFVSDRTFQQEFSPDINQRLNQSLTTYLNYSQRLKKLNGSLTVSFRSVQNLQTGQLDVEFPNASISLPSRSLIPAAKGTPPRWFNNLKIGYNSQLLSRYTKPPDADSLAKPTTLRGWNHRINMVFPLKIKYLRTTQSLNFNELWTSEYLNYRFVDSLNTLEKDTVRQFRARHTFSYNLSAQTTLYGLWSIPVLPLKLIRHKMDPSIRFSFAPDFTRPGFDYVQTFRDTTGRLLYGDRFANSTGGATPRTTQKRMFISIGNLFQGLWRWRGEEKKIDLFRATVNTGYDFERDSLQWDNITTSVTSMLSNRFQLNLRATHSMYENIPGSTRNQDVPFWKSDRYRFPRLVNYSVTFSTTFRFKGKEKRTGQEPQTDADTTSVEEDDLLGASTLNAPLGANPEREQLASMTIPWEITGNLDYRYQWSAPNRLQRVLSATIRARIQLTRNWKLTYNAQIDFIKRQLNYQRIEIYRDLHCWEMAFSWQPTYGFYNLEIRIKAPELRDLKLTRTSGRRAYIFQ